MAEKTRNLCAQIPTELHSKVRERQEESGQTLGQYKGVKQNAFFLECIQKALEAEAQEDKSAEGDHHE